MPILAPYRMCRTVVYAFVGTGSYTAARVYSIFPLPIHTRPMYRTTTRGQGKEEQEQAPASPVGARRAQGDREEGA